MADDEDQKLDSVPAPVAGRKADEGEMRSTDGGGEEAVDVGGGYDQAAADAEECHLVNVDVFIALAYPTPSEENARVLEQLIEKGKKTLDAPKPCYYFHCEYTLLPGHEPTITDVVTYPVAAKVFTDAADAKVVRTWNDGNLIWVTWNQTHEVLVTEEMAYQLHSHQIKVKITNGKDKVSQKAKNDKPKAFRIPGSSDSDSVKDAIAKVSSTWLLSQPRSSNSQLSQSLSAIDDELQDFEQETPKKVRSSLGRLAGVKKDPVKAKLKDPELTEFDRKRIIDLEKESDLIQKQLKKVHDLAAQFAIGTTNTMANGDEEERFGSVDYTLRFEALFSGETHVTSRLRDGFGPMCDAYIHVNLDKTLLPRGLEKKLNPMVLTVKSVKNLPNTPIPYTRLDEECKPIYCKYNFMNCEEVITPSAPHGCDAHFHDIRVFFLGAMDQTAVRQYIQENSFKIHIHDRDQKALTKKEENPPVLFGEELNDAKGGKGGGGGGGGKAAPKVDDDIFNNLPNLNYFAYHGVAHVSLMDLLKGQTNLYYEAAVLPSEAPEFTGKLMRAIQRENKDLKAAAAKKGGAGKTDVESFVCHPDYDVIPAVHEEDVTHNMKAAALKQRLACLPLPPGNYVANDTTLKIHIKLTRPLQFKPADGRVVQKGCFSRLVLIFSYNNKSLLKKVDEFVTLANAQALDLSHFEYHVMESALSTYKLTKEQKKSGELDLVTGFHVIDDDYHIFVLEGLLNGALKRLLEQVPRTRSEEDEVLMELYDSDVTFVDRKYTELDINLTRVRLYQTLSSIIQQPLIYIRDIIPKLCLDAILNLHKMTQTTRFRDLVSSQLFPSSQMILVLNRELGVAITFKDFEEHHHRGNNEEEKQQQQPIVVADTNKMQHKQIFKRNNVKTDQANEHYENVLKNRGTGHPTKDYITENMLDVRRMSVENGEKRLKEDVTYVRANVAGFNYSSQKRNSTVFSKHLLQKFLKTVDPKARFTYSDHFHWATVEPGRGEEKTDEPKQWKRKGFVCPMGRICNRKDVDEARKDELKLPFRDNILHANKLESPLEWRVTHEWNNKGQMKRYFKPKDYFSRPSERSIFSPKTATAERRHGRKEKEEWQDKLVVQDSRMYFHRVLPGTEKGNSSNQCDRMKSLLKDEPKKLSLKKYPTPNLPPIYMMNQDPGEHVEMFDLKPERARIPDINPTMTSQSQLLRSQYSATKSSKPSTAWSYETDFRFFRTPNVIPPVSASQQFFAEQPQHQSMVEQET